MLVYYTRYLCKVKALLVKFLNYKTFERRLLNKISSCSYYNHQGVVFSIINNSYSSVSLAYIHKSKKVLHCTCVHGFIHHKSVIMSSVQIQSVSLLHFMINPRIINVKWDTHLLNVEVTYFSIQWISWVHIVRP